MKEAKYISLSFRDVTQTLRSIIHYVLFIAPLALIIGATVFSIFDALVSSQYGWRQLRSAMGRQRWGSVSVAPPLAWASCLSLCFSVSRASSVHRSMVEGNDHVLEVGRSNDWPCRSLAAGDCSLADRTAKCADVPVVPQLLRTRRRKWRCGFGMAFQTLFRNWRIRKLPGASL